MLSVKAPAQSGLVACVCDERDGRIQNLLPGAGIAADPGHDQMVQMRQSVGVVDATALADFGRQRLLGLVAQRLGDVVHQDLGGHILLDGVEQLTAPSFDNPSSEASPEPRDHI